MASSFLDILKDGVSSTIDGVIGREFGTTSAATPIDQITPVIANPVTPLPSNYSQMIEGVDDKFVYIGGAILLTIVLAKTL